MKPMLMVLVLAGLPLLGQEPTSRSSRPALRAELLAMSAADQKARQALIDVGFEKASREQTRALTEVDRRNTARMKQIIADVGWPDADLVGEDGASAAFLLVQHADRDPAFQKQALALMKPAFEAGKVRGPDYALLHDRVSRAAGRPQRFGSQARGFRDGVLVFQEMEDRASVEAWRKKVGLPTLAAYARMMAQAYKQPELAYGLVSMGGIREVLHDGRSEGRVALKTALAGGTHGLGLLAGLEGEITVDAGKVHLAVVDGKQGLAQPRATGREQATLLFLATVPAWTSWKLPEIADLATLQEHVRATAKQAGLDPTKGPLPIRLDGSFQDLAIHVLNRSCPRAHPDGPAPWRLKTPRARGVVLGFYAEDMPGRLTHKGERLHVHATVRARVDGKRKQVSGHVDALRIPAGTRLELPLVWPPEEAGK